MKPGRPVLVLVAVILVAGMSTGAALAFYGALDGTADLKPSIMITEVHYAPNSTQGDEFVELYNPSTANVTVQDWWVNDTAEGDRIVNATQIPSGGYAVVTGRNGEVLMDSGVHLEVEDSDVGNGLDDTDEVVLSSPEGKVVDMVSYSDPCSDGESFQGMEDKQCMTPTPGEPTP